MFRNSNSEKLRARQGATNFDHCQTKSIRFTTRVYEKGTHGETIDIKDVKDGGTMHHAGNGGSLTCPKSEGSTQITSQFNDHPDKLAALDNIRQLAGSLICHSCVFATMSPMEVSIYRTDLATQEAKRLETEAILQKLQSSDETTRS